MDPVKRTGSNLLFGTVTQHAFASSAFIPHGAIGPDNRNNVRGILDQGAEAFLVFTQGQSSCSSLAVVVFNRAFRSMSRSPSPPFLRAGFATLNALSKPVEVITLRKTFSVR